MTIITLPTSFRPVGFSFGQKRYDTIERSDSTGSEAARLLAPPRWTCGVQSSDNMTLTEAGQWEAWCLKLRGSVNVAAIYDPVRRQPEGTLRGSPILGAASSSGATSVTISACTGPNLLQFVSNFANAYWSLTGASVTVNATTAPDGSTTADKLVEDTSNGFHYVRSAAITNGAATTYTLSVYGSGTERNLGLWIRSADGSSNYATAIFSLSGGGSIALAANVSGAGYSSPSASLSDVGSGWFRCSLTATVASSVTSIRAWHRLSSGTTTSYLGDGASGVHIWGAQLEEGASASVFAYPTLKAGDAIQIGTGVGTSQLVKVVADAAATAFAEAVWSTGGGAQALWSGSGGAATWSDDGLPGESMSITFEPPLRTSFAISTAVTWDRPVAYYRMQGYPKWQYSQRAYRREGGFAADFVETFSA